MRREVAPAATMRGTVRVPGDKSASHRALMISALADGESTIEGISHGDDVKGTASIMAALGATVETSGDVLTVRGPREGLRPASHYLDCGNSGTTIRLLAGLLAGVEGDHHLVGDASLSRRPMDRVAIPLRLMGAAIHGTGPQETAPLSITGRSRLHGITYRTPVVSAQVKSAILFAALAGDGPTTVNEDVRTRATTEVMFQQAGINIAATDQGPGRVVTIEPGRPTTQRWHILGDPSQAAFFVVAGLLAPESHVVLRNVDSAPERTGFLSVLARMGASIEWDRSTGDIEVRGSELAATVIHSRDIPSVDEVPILVVAAAAATGETRFENMAELRLKESDRFMTSVALARSLGCDVHTEGDDFVVSGLGDAKKFQAIAIDAGLDHRLVMSAAIAGAVGHGAVIDGVETVSSSYPGFFDDLASVVS